jgi:phage replication O-like protein O
MADSECYQLEDGFVMIAHGIFDSLIQYPMSANCLRVVLCIIRKTYGFGKKEAQISLDTFVRRTGIRKPHVRRALTALVYHNIITQSGNKRIPTYGYQKYSSKWKAWEGDRPKPKSLPNRVTIVTHMGNAQSYKETIKRNNIPPLTPPPKKPKPKKQKPKTDEFVFTPPDWLDMKLWNQFLEHRKKIKSPMTDLAQHLAVIKLERYTGNGHTQRDVIEQSIINGWRGLFPVKDNHDPEARRRAKEARWDQIRKERQRKEAGL